MRMWTTRNGMSSSSSRQSTTCRRCTNALCFKVRVRERSSMRQECVRVFECGRQRARERPPASAGRGNGAEKL
eukprot:75736-Pleurochrysis_carterae.AAC.3